MAIQTINIGNVVNDGLGDDLRSAFTKVNANFADLAAQQTVTGTNVGAGTGVGIFKQRVGGNLQFKSLVSDGKITLTPSADAIIVGTIQKDSFSRITTNSGSITANIENDFDQITVQGGTNVNVTASARTITIDTKQDLATILNEVDFGQLESIPTNVVAFLIQSVDLDFGTFEIPAAFEYDAGTL